VVITHQTISRLNSNEDVEPNLDYDEEEAKQTNSDEVPNDSEGVQQGYIKSDSEAAAGRSEQADQNQGTLLVAELSQRKWVVDQAGKRQGYALWR